MAALSHKAGPTTAEEHRAAMVEAVLGTLRIEGLEPSADVRLWLDEFAAGTRTIEELEAALSHKSAVPASR